jgi:hypothetical protein
MIPSSGRTIAGKKWRGGIFEEMTMEQAHEGY